MANLSADLEHGISTIFDFSPAFNNLYTLKLYPLIGSDDPLSPFFEFHSTKVTFNGESLEMKRNEITKRFQFTENPYRRTENISITLRENEKWAVKRYHEDWLAKFYNKQGDYYLSAKNDSELFGRYRLLRIILPNSDACIKMLILPSNSGNIDLGWSTSGDIISHNLTYNVENWCWEKF